MTVSDPARYQTRGEDLSAQEIVPLGLGLGPFTILLARTPGRGICRSCMRERICFQLQWRESQTIMYATDLKCAQCAGLRLVDSG
jgi:hypothetical protein